MITSAQCLERYGKPELEKAMVLFDVPKELELGVIPKRVYCNKDLVKPLTQAFKNIIDRGLVDQLKTWDGCFNIRNKKSGLSPSLHSWGLAIDINAAWNGFNKKPTMSKELVQCFKDAGFEWGGDWKVKDGMHFQLKEFPK
jgi:hypothetical protein